MTGFTAEWPSDKCDRLAELIGQRLSGREIGRLMDKTRNAIIGRAYRSGWKLQGGTDATRRTKSSQFTPEERKERERMRLQKRERGRFRIRSAPIPKSQPMPAERPLPPTSAPVTLLEAGSNQCRYIAGPTQGPHTLVCGAPGYPWCGFHRTLLYTPSTPRQRARIGSYVPRVG